MFIVQTKNGDTYVEGKDGFVWDHVPEDTEISSLSLTLPFKIKFQTKNGEVSLNPKFTIKDFDAYYFSNEETVSIVAVNGVMGQGTRALSAKIIAGIKGDIVVEYRMDKHGNIKNTVFPLNNLDVGFNKQCIRKGLTA